MAFRTIFEKCGGAIASAGQMAAQCLLGFIRIWYENEEYTNELLHKKMLACDVVFESLMIMQYRVAYNIEYSFR